jgi:hypothetical protein
MLGLRFLNKEVIGHETYLEKMGWRPGGLCSAEWFRMVSTGG